MSLDEITEAIHNQVAYADDRYGPFTSAHEGFGVLAEEVAELLEAIRTNDAKAITAESIQVAAVASRIAVSLLNPQTRKRSGVSE
jgi:NTP pyrophosphatase (non-canonical NTP hydrolase)